MAAQRTDVPGPGSTKRWLIAFAGLAIGAIAIATVVSRGRTPGGAGGAAGRAASAASGVSLPADVSLATSTASAPPDPAAPIIWLSPTRLRLGADSAAIASVPSDAALYGFDASCKRGGRNDYFLVPLWEALAAHFEGDASLPEVTLGVDASVPYRLFLEVLYTVRQSLHTQAKLLVRSGGSQAVVALGESSRGAPCDAEQRALYVAILAAIPEKLDPTAKRAAIRELSRLRVTDAGPLPLGGAEGEGPPVAPSASPPGPAVLLPSQSALCLTVIAADLGFDIGAFSQRVGPGCTLPGGPGTAVARREGSYDFAGLTSCAAELKRHASTWEAVVTANSQVPMQTLVSTMDALRADPRGGPLFAMVELGAAR